MQHGAMVRLIFLAGEHGFNRAGQTVSSSRSRTLCQRLFGDAPGEIHQHQIVKRRGKFSENGRYRSRRAQRS